MNRAQAQEILRLYRPGSADADDPDFAEALEFARRDAELGRWLDAHCATYGTIRDRLKEAGVPPGLKDRILAEQSTQSKIVPLPRSSGRNPLLAVAAVILLLLGISFLWFQSRARDNYSTYRNRMVSAALRIYGMDLETNDLNQVWAFLAERNAPSDYELSPELQKLECTGCVVVRWQDQPVSMICFRTGRPLAPGEKSDLFFFVTDRASFSKSSMSLKRVNRLVTASWTKGNKTYLLATHGDEEFLRKFL